MPASDSPWVMTMAPIPYVFPAAAASRVIAAASKRVAAYACPDVPVVGKPVGFFSMTVRGWPDSPTTV